MKNQAQPKMSFPATFNLDNYHQLCDHLATIDPHFQSILEQYSYPPMWTRDNTFETLAHIILEQQVSLASALATLNKLKAQAQTERLSPNFILQLSDEELRACYVSRQKAVYLRELAKALTTQQLQLEQLTHLTNDEVREILLRIKGIGHWTIDVYLMFVLQRVDIFPIGDLAAVNALKHLKQLPAATAKEELLPFIEQWKPLRTVASMMLWHYYLSRR